MQKHAPTAIIQWPEGTEYTGIWRDKKGTWIDSHRSWEKYRVQTGILTRMREAGKVRYVEVHRAGVNGRTYLNHEGELALAAAEYHRSPAVRCRLAQRQRAPSGDWYLSPRAFRAFVGVSKSADLYWRRHGVPILGGVSLDGLHFTDGTGRPTLFFSEAQAKEIVKARKSGKSAKESGGLVSEDVAAQRCGVSVNRVRRLAKARAIESERRPKHNGRQSVEVYFVSVNSLRDYLHRSAAEKHEAKTIPDPVTVREAGRICKVAAGTINSWIKAGKIGHENLGHVGRGGRRFVVSRREVLDFATRQRVALASGDGESWLHRRQVRIQFPGLSLHALEYYSNSKRKLPVLGRPVRSRTVDRPAGLKCPYERVTQYWAEDVRLLAEWLEGRGLEDQRSLPCVKGRTDAMKGAASNSADKNTVGEMACRRVERGEKYWEQIVETRKRVEEIHRAIPRIPEKTADAVCERLPQMAGDPRTTESPPSLADRLQIDLASFTAILDGDTFSGVNADGLRALDALRKAQLEGKTPIPKRKLRGQYLPQCYHDTTLTRWFDALPERLHKLVEGQSGAGLRLVLPPL